MNPSEVLPTCVPIVSAATPEVERAPGPCKGKRPNRTRARLFREPRLLSVELKQRMLGLQNSQLSGYHEAEQGTTCGGCGQLILERVQLQVDNCSWHVDCLRCCVCDCLLEKDTNSTCFFRDNNVYCKQDYARQFGVRCSKCTRGIQSSDWVRRARDQVYHLACFACEECKRQLSTGEEFALHDGRVLCKIHYCELIDPGSQSTDDNADQDHNPRAKTKRVRTTFTEEQLSVLQANFNLDSNPDGQDLERIAQITGLSKRVTQVWFQNSRARQKKYYNNQNKNNNKPIGVTARATSTTPCVSCGLMYCMCSPNSSVISPSGSSQGTPISA